MSDIDPVRTGFTAGELRVRDPFLPLGRRERARVFAARNALREVLLCDIARIVRALFPTADQLVVHMSDQRALVLGNVLDAAGMPLLGAVAPNILTADGFTWRDVGYAVQDMLLEALGEDDPDDHWVTEAVGRYSVHHVTLPSRDHVATVLAQVGRGPIRRWIAALRRVNRSVRRLGWRTAWWRQGTRRDVPTDTTGRHHLVGLGMDVPCDLTTVRITDGLTVSAHACELHSFRPTETEAREAFVCDLGRMWEFIVHLPDVMPRPVMTGLSGLVEEAHAFFDGGHELPTVWRYLHDGTCRAVTVTCERVDGDALLFVAADAADGMVYLSVRSD